MNDRIIPLSPDEQRLMAKALRSSSDLVYSFDLAPVNVNILPMQLIIDTETVDRCADALMKRGWQNPTYAREIVLSVLKAATDIGRGSTEHSKSKVGGTATGASSGADNDSVSN